MTEDPQQLGEPVASSMRVSVASGTGGAFITLDAAAELADPAGLPDDNSGATLGPAALAEKVNGAVVSVIPLYIMVTEGHMLSEKNGPPDLGKQYCSTTVAADIVADASADCASLQPHTALAASRRSGSVIM